MSDVVDTGRVGFTFIWKIENFSLVPRLNRRFSINSILFTADNLGRTYWCLELEPFGFLATNKRAFTFRLVKSPSLGPKTICLDYELSVLFNGDSIVKSIVKCAEQFQQDTPRGIPLNLAWHEIFSKKEILHEDILTVQCKMWYNKGHCLDPGFCLSRMRFGAERKTFIWPIDNFSNLEINEAKSVSVDFQTNFNFSLTIILFLSVTYGEKIRIKVAVENKGIYELIITLGIAVQDINGKSTNHVEDELKWPTGNSEQTFPLILEKHQFVSKQNLYLPKNVLSLKCAFTVTKFRPYDAITLNEIERTTYGIDAVNDLKEATKKLEPTFLKNNEHLNFSSLENDMKHLFESKYLTDIDLKVKNEVFSAHKAILGARSSVFKTMFETDMKEKITNTIEIEDFDPDTIRRLLLYIYSDHWFSGLPTQNVPSLCLAAEKYDVVGLKKTCLSCLENRISAKNVYRILKLADMLRDEELMNSVENYIQNNSDIMNSDTWKQFSIEHPRLIIEILTRLYRNK